MILRRLTEHVQAQNWLAVVLDFIIVVVGVFIGIQVSNWNEARNDRIDAGDVLERLEQDFQQNLDRTNRSLNFHVDNLAAVARLIEGIRTGQFDTDTLNADMKRASNFGTPPGPSTTFLELVSGSRLRLIKSAELTRTLYDYNDYVTFVRSQYGYFTEPLNDARSVLMPARRLVVTGEPSGVINDTWSTENVDQSILANDPNMLAALQLAYGTQDNIHAVLLGNQKRINAILELIKAEQGAAQ